MDLDRTAGRRSVQMDPATWTGLDQPLPRPAGLSVVGRLGALLVPWTFVLVFGLLCVWLLLPRVLEGHLLAVCVGVFVAFTLAVSILAAVTFSRDILSGRWP